MCHLKSLIPDLLRLDGHSTSGLANTLDIISSKGISSGFSTTHTVLQSAALIMATESYFKSGFFYTELKRVPIFPFIKERNLE